ncbi:EamA-like transporter family protein [uncultured archaeon]|nr:EamA-like transporter family protein [uncultured archaeon]
MLETFFSIPPILFAIFATVGVSAWSLLSRKILRGEKDFIGVGAATEMLSLGILLLFFLSLNGALGGADFDPASVPPVGWAALAVSFFAYMAAVLSSYKGFQSGEANERAVINQVQNIFTLLVAAALLAEPLTGPKVAGVLLITAGAVICTYRPDHARWKVEGVRLFLLSALCFGVGGMSDKVAMQYFPVALYAPVSFLGPALAALVLLGRQAVPRMKTIWKRHRFWMPVLALISVAPYVLFLLALKAMPISVLGPLMNTNIVLTAVGGMLLLGEHDSWKQKIAGALLALAGAWMIGG